MALKCKTCIYRKKDMKKFLFYCKKRHINGSIYRTEPLCTPWEIESRLQSLLNSYDLNWFKSSVKIIVKV